MYSATYVARSFQNEEMQGVCALKQPKSTAFVNYHYIHIFIKYMRTPKQVSQIPPSLPMVANPLMILGEYKYYIDPIIFGGYKLYICPGSYKSYIARAAISVPKEAPLLKLLNRIAVGWHQSCAGMRARR